MSVVKLRQSLLLFVLLICHASTVAQVTTKGKDFWLGFTENDFLPGHSLEVWINTEERANVTIRTPLGNFTNIKVVDPGRNSLVILPSELMAMSEGKHDFGISITSDVDISVYALNKLFLSMDATTVLPTEALDTEYYVMAHVKSDTLSNDAGEANMLIVATEDNTEIIVVPSADTFGGWLAGETQNITLNAGQTYQIKSLGDLTGTYVRAVVGADRNCKKIAVFSGNKSTNVGACGPTKDHLMEQMPPISSWGRNFLYVPYQTREGGDFIKIMASEDGTRIQVDGVGTIELNAGNFYLNEALEGATSISADKPIAVGQFSRSQGCDDVDSDPFMIMLGAIDQGINAVNFSAIPIFRTATHYLTLVASSNNLSNIMFDGIDITDQFTVQGNAAYANVVFQPGNHRITAENGVLPYVYAYGEEESFGYLAGATLGNADLIEISESLTIATDNQICVGLPTNFMAEFDVLLGEDPVFDTFEWDFGDGTIGLEKNVAHVFDVAGEYEVMLTASNGRSLCNNSASVTKIITVRELAINEFVGPLSVCPLVTGIEYFVDGPPDNTYEWFIEGGTITSGGNSGRITVDWGVANENALIRVLPVNLEQCNTDTLSFDVKINQALQPALPKSNGFSPDGVCFDEFENVTYFTSQTAGSDYEWFVDGHGQILGSNLGNEINVKWNGPGTGQVWYREYNPSIANCEGFSDRLTVTIYEEIRAAPTITNVLCNGESNGTISLVISGGKPGDYTVEWDNGMSGESITDLIVGNYTATITDELGCEFRETFNVAEPDVLEITDAEASATLCFQAPTGRAELMVSGGTPFNNGEYMYRWESNGRVTTTNSRVVDGLRGGDYTVTVTDLNGCEVSMNFVVTEPTQLEADLETLLNPAICPQANNGTAFIDAKGGTPDYRFFWSNNNATDDANASNLSKGSYSVRILDANDCETTLNVNVSERFPRVSVPNAFSPNGDGLNDDFKPVTDCSLPFSMQVYNKWGAIIFSSEDVTVGWDGRFEGQEAPSGNYSYIIFYTVTLNDKTFEESHKGSFKLIR